MAMMTPMMGGAWMLLWVLLAVVLVIGALFLIRTLIDPDRSSGSSAIRILEDRFARGEIDRDEFEDGRRALES